MNGLCVHNYLVLYIISLNLKYFHHYPEGRVLVKASGSFFPEFTVTTNNCQQLSLMMKAFHKFGGNTRTDGEYSYSFS